MTRRTLAVLALGVAFAIPCTPAGAQTVTLWAVGDGALAGPTDDRVADMIGSQGPFDRLLYLGDVYETGTAEEYDRHYRPSYGRFRDATSPTPGNHEWGNRATGYDPYWGSRAPQTDGGHWYSFDLGGWHVVSLNTEEDTSGDSPQVAWLRRDLRAYPGSCTIAFFHQPRYTANPERDNSPDFEPFWDALSGRARLVLNAHDHDYQRFKTRRGLTQFVVGTGGANLYPLDESDPRLAFADDRHFGALRLRLRTGTGSFEFLTDAGRLLDSGSFTCKPHDSAEAVVSIARPASRRTYSQRLASFRGRTRNTGGPVTLTLVKRGKRCKVWSGSRFRRSSCRTRRGVEADGVERWSYELGERLPRGRYKLTVRAGDARNGVRFRIR